MPLFDKYSPAQHDPPETLRTCRPARAAPHPHALCRTADATSQQTSSRPSSLLNTFNFFENSWRGCGGKVGPTTVRIGVRMYSKTSLNFSLFRIQGLVIFALSRIYQALYRRRRSGAQLPTSGDTRSLFLHVKYAIVDFGRQNTPSSLSPKVPFCTKLP